MTTRASARSSVVEERPGHCSRGGTPRLWYMTLFLLLLPLVRIRRALDVLPGLPVRRRGDRHSLAFCALLFLVFLTLELDGNEDFPARTIVAPLIALYALILVFLPVLLLVTRHYVRVRCEASL